MNPFTVFLLNKSPFNFAEPAALDNSSSRCLHTKQELYSEINLTTVREKLPQNRPPLVINEQAYKSPWSMGGYEEMPQIYPSQLCSAACGFYGPMQECVHLYVCLCVLKGMNAAKPLPVWNGGPIMTVSFSMHP